MSEREEVLLERGFVLHHRPYRNTSLIVDCLTAGHGRLTLVAQGARRPGASFAAALQPFRRVLFSWIRRGELGRLVHVEADAGASQIGGDALIAAFYLNELLLRLVPSGDQSDRILSCYSSCLDLLAATRDAARPLRIFELELLEALGYRVDLEQDFHTGEPIAPGREYVLEHDSGLTAWAGDPKMETFNGRHLISLREHRLDDPGSLGAAKRLLGQILRFHLGARPLETRRVMREIVERNLAS